MAAVAPGSGRSPDEVLQLCKRAGEVRCTKNEGWMNGGKSSPGDYVGGDSKSNTVAWSPAAEAGQNGVVDGEEEVEVLGRLELARGKEMASWKSGRRSP
jgi:hypothetical protein